ncbi:DUF1769-domain-containing protein [Mollisia scopiformis]|uniref:DUF1769-domain-containing protein n=1 Tax=Mollisia scopiformis TaxID=149040 RepID=A0A194XG29_MOLSC|nr:DUF1769-domain-containing protein [Mollisia scopiformis]KUJ18727.1 DUF1769-domain-containing protein [Mollisia scopiformis]
MAHNYILQVTAGSSYDIKHHQIVPVNQPTPITITSPHLIASLNVRIAQYRGLPPTSPATSPYFTQHPKDQYSISFAFTLNEDVNGDDLVFGNDFDHPIRDRLPPGFGTAFKIVKWVVDPGLDGDVYADKPYLYGAAGSSVNALWVGGKSDEKGEKEGEDGGEEKVWEEGGSEEGMEVRHEKGVPDSEAGRKKWFLGEENRKSWTWEQGRCYGVDFFNPYLDFNGISLSHSFPCPLPSRNPEIKKGKNTDFALRLPGFTLPIMKYWDGQGLRYVLKNRKTDEVLLVVLFTLYLKEDVGEDGVVKDGVEGGKPIALLGEGERERHRRAIFGTDGEGEESSGEEEEEDERSDGDEGKEKKVEVGGNGDDDVD